MAIIEIKTYGLHVAAGDQSSVRAQNRLRVMGCALSLLSLAAAGTPPPLLKVTRSQEGFAGVSRETLSVKRSGVITIRQTVGDRLLVEHCNKLDVGEMTRLRRYSRAPMERGAQRVSELSTVNSAALEVEVDGRKILQVPLKPGVDIVDENTLSEVQSNRQLRALLDLYRELRLRYLSKHEGSRAQPSC